MLARSPGHFQLETCTTTPGKYKSLVAESGLGRPRLSISKVLDYRFRIMNMGKDTMC